MIQEQYVSFETAKLLREKGFDELCKQFYNSDGILKYHKIDIVSSNSKHIPLISDIPTYYSAPTQAMTTRWLREYYNFYIEIDVLGMGKKYGELKWRSVVYFLDNMNECYCEDKFDSYEEACEAAIKYCLENLI